MKKFLNKQCYLVTGANHGAIYDLKKEQVYSINNASVKLIKDVLSNKIKEMDTEQTKYINQLISLELLTTKKTVHVQDPSTYKMKLNFAWLELTDLCNLNCVHCYGEFGKPSLEAKERLNLDDWKKVIDTLISYNCESIQFIGGEPLAYKNFSDILEYAGESKIKDITVFTNATLLNEELVSLFQKYNVNVRVSVYGHNSNIHDEITGVQGSFLKNKEALLLLKKYKIDTSIAIVIMKENEQYLEEIKKYLKSIDYKYNGYDVIRKTDFNHQSKHSITDYKLLKNRYIINPEFHITQQSFWLNHFYNPCWNSKISISANGDVLPCVFTRDITFGNIKKDAIDTIKNEAKKYWTLTKDKIEVCKDCEFRYCCHDCRPLAIGINGDINSKYPRCCYNPYEGKWQDIETCSKEII